MGELLITLDGYSIYKYRHNSAGEYYLCVPNNPVERYQLFIGFAEMVLSSLPKEVVVEEVRKVSDAIHTINSNGVYLLPDLPVEELEQAARENDDRKYNEILTNRIQPITAEIFRLLTQAKGVDNAVDQTINMVKRNDKDKKLAGWLSMKLGDAFIREMDYDKLKEMEIERNNFDETKNIHFDSPAPVSQEKNQTLGATPNMNQTFSSGIAPIDRQYEQQEPSLSRQNNLVRKRVKENGTSPGFSNIKFIIAVLMASLVIGISIGCLLIK